MNENGRTLSGATSGSETANPVPIQVAGLSDVATVAGGEDYTLALRTDGTVWSWGLNTEGQLGTGTPDNLPHPAPAEVPDLSGVIALATSPTSQHSLALRDDGTVWAWGYNHFG